ncbi:MAG: flagellar assembly protein FliW [Desulfatirhabdiaceae bacterium]
METRQKNNSSQQALPMLDIETTRFGVVSIEADKIITFPEGLLGLPEQKDYCILEHQPGSPFYWLQSVTAPYLAFIVINPLLGEPEYLNNLPQIDRKLFQGIEEEKIVILSLVTVKPDDPKPLTMNLVGPIVIDQASRSGKQVILSSTRYSCKHPLKLG